MQLTEEKRGKSLRFSFFDGVFASAMIGFIQEYFTPFLLLLGATVKQVGILNALPTLCASLVQLKSADLTEILKSRKRTINIFVLLQALMLLPMVFIALTGGARPYIFIITVILFSSFGALANPAWGSLMSDLVPKNKRGRYFGWRTRVLGFITVGAAFLAGLILHIMKRINIFSGFTLIFIFAFLFRIISWHFLKRMYEPPLEYKKEHRFSFMDFLLQIRKSNFTKFVFFVALMNFSVNLASPFFAVLMLRDLQFNYLLYALIITTAALTVNIIIVRWGRLADKIGNLRIIRFTSSLIGVIPLLWVICQKPGFLIIAQIFSGFLWAGFNLCATNFIYDAVIPEKRTRCISYFNVVNGLALSAGALLGGFLLQRLPAVMGYRILTLFLISAVLRTIVGIFGPMRLKEVRSVERMHSNELFFSMIGIKPLLGIERKTIRM